MEINLDDIAIQAPEIPTESWNLNHRYWENYVVKGFLNSIPVGQINICRGLNTTNKPTDSFFLDLSQDPPIPKPYVGYQETKEEFRGHGVCGRLILLSNEFYRGRLGTTLYSDTHFVKSFREQSKRVWEKLQEQGLAVFEPCIISGQEQGRWFVV